MRNGMNNQPTYNVRIMHKNTSSANRAPATSAEYTIENQTALTSVVTPSINSDSASTKSKGVCSVANKNKTENNVKVKMNWRTEEPA